MQSKLSFVNHSFFCKFSFSDCEGVKHGKFNNKNLTKLIEKFTRPIYCYVCCLESLARGGKNWQSYKINLVSKRQISSISQKVYSYEPSYIKIHVQIKMQQIFSCHSWNSYCAIKHELRISQPNFYTFIDLKKTKLLCVDTIKA